MYNCHLFYRKLMTTEDHIKSIKQTTNIKKCSSFHFIVFTEQKIITEDTNSSVSKRLNYIHVHH